MKIGEQWRLSGVDSRSIYAVAGWYIHPFKSIIFTKDGVHYSELTAFQVLEELCIRNGASYKGREEATRALSNRRYTKKVPVLIATPGVAAFPTCSPNHLDCVWLFNHFMTFTKLTESKTQVEFLNGEKICVKASVAMLEKQRSRNFSVVGFYTLHTY
ncbi:competence protein ComK [Chryseomicrobium aureum]|uniref:competence protein ComK n=1 Tax=Chryseomicrobium aureum TaxID=1441723 RepID=UPI00195E8E0D|nr:competence protein ComK [Chryseomicrobium aureum]MBM7706935.1 competence protein ComK [Chryseomicrobium aureum]